MFFYGIFLWCLVFGILLSCQTRFICRNHEFSTIFTTLYVTSYNLGRRIADKYLCFSVLIKYYVFRRAAPVLICLSFTSSLIKTPTHSHISYSTFFDYIIIQKKGYSMVFRLDGCSFHVAHAWRKISGKNTRFDDSFDVTKCLQQIEKPDLLHVCA